MVLISRPFTSVIYIYCADVVFLQPLCISRNFFIVFTLHDFVCVASRSPMAGFCLRPGDVYIFCVAKVFKFNNFVDEGISGTSDVWHAAKSFTMKMYQQQRREPGEKKPHRSRVENCSIFGWGYLSSGKTAMALMYTYSQGIACKTCQVVMIRKKKTVRMLFVCIIRLDTADNPSRVRARVEASKKSPTRAARECTNREHQRG